MEENKFGYDEIVDTVSDAVKAEVRAYDVFKGKKFDIAKALTWAIGEYGTIKEAYEDWEVFEAQIKDLNDTEAIEAIAQIAAKLTDEEKAKSRIFKFAVFSATGYKNTIAIIKMGKEQLRLGEAIFAK